MQTHPAYRVLIHQATLEKTKKYLHSLINGTISGGRYLRHNLANQNLAELSPENFLQLLINTKIPQIFAESAVAGDGSDWTMTELSILGDISIAVPVTVFDDGRHCRPDVHSNPFQATLLYTPGALLKNGRGQIPADWPEVVHDGKISRQGLYSLYARRLLPSFAFANRAAQEKNTKALITLPGLGCGCFAGPFQGQLGALLQQVIAEFISKNIQQFPYIRAVYFDPYAECRNQRLEFEHISFLVRPLTQGNETKPQLCHPMHFEDTPGEFAHCDLFSLVAWDHVSWPGNDFYGGSRMTDDGVKSAATDSMAVMTGVDGVYNPKTYSYNPPKTYRNWREVVTQLQLKIQLHNNLVIQPD